VQTGELAETATLDAKRALPKQGKSKDIAIDVAAMANDGGTLIYGIGEDREGRPTIPTPFELAGAVERVDQIVRSCISEPPAISIRTIATDNDPTIGYLVVAVPPSPCAPHMVVVAKDRRFYGRGATGNVRLTEGEVARLYERRRSWDVDREALLADAIDRAPLEPDIDFAYLHLIARPVVPDDTLLDRAKGDLGVKQFLDELFSAAAAPGVFPRCYSPDLLEHNHFVRRADSWATSQGLDEERRLLARDPSTVWEFEVGLDGSCYLFYGRAAEAYSSGLLISEVAVAGMTTRFLSVLSALYDAGSYLGPVDVGLAVNGLQGGISMSMAHDAMFSPVPFDKEQYTRTGRFLPPVLKEDPGSAARDLVLPLARATTQESFDPFASE
jgi:hypothetical protein